MKLSRWLAAALLLVPALGARAQHLGDVSISTVQQTLFPSLTSCTGLPQTASINNLGQTSHAVTVVFSNVSTQVSFSLQGSNDGVNFTRMSDTIQNAGTGIPTTLQASGYYTLVQFTITCTSPGVFSATYSGSGVPPVQPQGQGLAATIEKLLYTGVATALATGTTFPPYGNMAGVLVTSNTGGTFTGASVLLTCAYVDGQTASQTFNLSGAGVNAVVVGQQPCPQVNWRYNQGTSTGTANIEYVFSAGFSGATGSGTGTGGLAANVQGTVAQKALATSVNPIVLGGEADALSTCGNGGIANSNLPITVFGNNVNELTSAPCAIFGMAIGDGALNPVNTFTGITVPNVGPMASAIFATRSEVAGQSINTYATPNGGFSPGGATAGSATNTGSSSLEENAGEAFLSTSTTITANGSTQATTAPEYYGIQDACYVTVTTGAPTGTSPTLDVWFQDSNDGVHFMDRLHFIQITNNVNFQQQVASVSVNGTATTGASLNLAPVAMSNKSIAAGTIIHGAMGQWRQFAWTIGGTTPSFPTVQFGFSCH